MYRSVLLSVCLMFICLTVSKAKVVQKRQTQFEVTQLDLSTPSSLNLQNIVNLAENLLKRHQGSLNRPTYDVIVHYQPYQPSPYQHFQQPLSWYGNPPPPPPPPPPHGGPHPPPPFGGPHPPPPPPYGGPHPPPPFGGPPPHGGPPQFGGPPPHGGPPPFERPPPNRGRPDWIPIDMTGIRPSEFNIDNRPPPGFIPSPYTENPSTGFQIQKYPTSPTNAKLEEDKKKISGYIDGDFPVILLDPENEIRR